MDRRKPSLGMIVVVLGLLLIAGWVGYKAWRVLTLVQALQADYDRVRALLPGSGQAGQLDAQAAITLVHTTRGDFAALKSEAGPLLAVAPLLSWVPVYGGDIAAAPDLLVVGDELTLAAEVLVGDLAPLVDSGPLPEGSSRISHAVGVLVAARPHLEDAQAALGRARAAWERVDTSRLSPRTARLAGRLDEALPLLEAAVGAGLALPDVLGWSAPRTYLILAQNDDEARGTGGFITAVGIARVERGQIADLQFLPSWAVDDYSVPYPDPPAPLTRFMGLELWVLRDANWSPDFPTAARLAIQLYGLNHRERIDGAIAVDQPMLQLLVGALGPLTVEGYDRPVTADNVIAYMREAWGASEQSAAPWSRHKDFIPKLASTLFARVQSASTAGELVALGKAVLTALDQRHLAIYVQDAALAQTLAHRGWDGSLHPLAQDGLMVVDQNMGYNKVNAALRVDLRYRIDLSAPSPAARVDITYTNPAPDTGEACRFQIEWGPTYEEQTQRCYWGYVRVLAPAGSELTGGARHEVPAAAMRDGRAYSGGAVTDSDPSGRAVFANYLLVPRNQSVATWFEYRLPATVVVPAPGGYRYALYIQKQAGSRGHALTVEAQLPPGARVLSASPEPAAVEDGVVRWQMTLDVDRQVEVVFTR